MALFWSALCLLFLPCSYGSINFTLQEEEPLGTLVGNIPKESSLGNNMTDQEFQSLKYDFWDQTKMASLFTINNDNGNIYRILQL